MAPSEPWDFERAVAGARPRRFRGTVWRTHWRAISALDWSLSLRTSGRYHRGEDLFPVGQTFPALYTSLAPEIAIWEMVRRSVARNLAYLQNNVLSELQLDLTRVLDLSDPVSIGLVQADLTASDFRRCQDLAAAAISHRYEGILAPSAALPGLNIVILPTNLAGVATLRLVRTTELPLDAIVPNT